MQKSTFDKEIIDPRHLLIKVSEILERLKIQYAVTGGMAIYVWGRPRFTADIDIVILLKEENIDEIAVQLHALSEASYIEKYAIRRALAKYGEFNFIDGESGIKVDFWVLEKKPFAESQLKRRVHKTILGKNVFFISPEDLILSKLLWHKESESSRQLEDVESILKIQKKLDWKYLRKWAQKQSTLKILESLWKKTRK